MSYFAEIETLGELKKAFRKLAFENHPDCGGDTGIMRDIICEYQRLASILPDIEPEPANADEASHVENTPASETPRFHCPYKPATAGGANPRLARLATPVFSHKEICLMAKSLFVYARLDEKEDLREFYRKLCLIIDPGQWKPYRDYYFDRKVALESLKLIRKKVLSRIFTAELWRLVKTSQANLQKAA